MPIERTALPGFGHVQPYKQGDLSSLCGIYAALNAARLLVPERAAHRALWKDGYAFAVTQLSAKRKLTAGVRRGLSFETWKVMQQALYDHLSDRVDVSLHMRPLLRRSADPNRDLAGDICSAIDAGKAVLCALYGSHDHYTIIAGYTASSWLLHDSSGLRRVERAATGIGRPQGRLHWIPFTSLIVLSRMDKAS